MSYCPHAPHYLRFYKVSVALIHVQHQISNSVKINTNKNTRNFHIEWNDWNGLWFHRWKWIFIIMQLFDNGFAVLWTIFVTDSSVMDMKSNGMTLWGLWLLKKLFWSGNQVMMSSCWNLRGVTLGIFIAFSIINIIFIVGFVVIIRFGRNS